VSLKIGGRTYIEHWDLDAEFVADGNPLEVVSLTAHEQLSGRRLQFTTEQLKLMKESPIPDGPDVLHSGYGYAAEAGVFHRLGWKLSTNVFCLYAGFRRITNGEKLRGAKPNGLIGALTHFGEDSLSQTRKDAMHKLIARGGYTPDEWREILDYNTSDVEADERLHKHLFKALDDTSTWRLVLYDGEGMKAWAHVQAAGVPIDTQLLCQLREHWDAIKAALITAVDKEYNCYNDNNFNFEKFDALLMRHGIGWPRTPTGQLKHDAQTFHDMCEYHTFLRELYDLRVAIDQLKLEQLTVGLDGRNRVSYNPLGAITGRCTPSTNENVLGVARWLRHIVQPPEGRVLINADFEQEEFAIAAILSGDPIMLAVYLSGDVYLDFARRAGRIHPGMTEQQIRVVRDQFKVALLAIGYGKTAQTLSLDLGVTLPEAREFITSYERLFSKHTRWVRRVISEARKNKVMHDVLRWPLHVVSGYTRRRTLGNFPVQAAGFQIMRKALMLLQNAGIMVCATAHDSLLCECVIEDEERVKHTIVTKMVEAGQEFLAGHKLRVETTIIRHPDHYEDKKGSQFWEKVQKILGELQEGSSMVQVPDNLVSKVGQGLAIYDQVPAHK
jgi:DNA polymerase I-like protein with 3'-5' exonuclease and polymerase domains